MKRPTKKPKIFVPKIVGPKPTSPRPRFSVNIKEELAKSSSEIESSYDDSDYDSSDDELEITEPSPLPPTRPPEPLKAVRYDTIKAVWLPRQRPAEADKIRNALKDFWEVVRTIRDRWKTDGEAVKKAEEAKKLNELPLLRERVKSQREMLEVALQTANEFGHPDILRLYVPFPFSSCYRPLHPYPTVVLYVWALPQPLIHERWNAPLVALNLWFRPGQCRKLCP